MLYREGGVLPNKEVRGAWTSHQVWRQTLGQGPAKFKRKNVGSSVTTRHRSWGKSLHSGVISEIQRVKFGIIFIYIFWRQNLLLQQEFRGKFWGQAPRPPNMKAPPEDILKVAVSTLSAKAKLFNNSIFNWNGNVAQHQDDGDDHMDDDDHKMPSQGQIVDLPTIHSQMTDAEIKKYFKKENLLEMSVTRAKRIVSEVVFLNNGFLKATTFNQKVGRHLTLLLSTINEA